MTLAVLAGGVGGARFLRALTEAGHEVSAIVNVGDDFDVHGLRVCPDLDTVLYTLAGVGDDERGWGRAGETWHALETLRELGGDGWFALGDRDLGLHLVRTEALRRGEPLSTVTARFAEALGVGARLLPATDDELRTSVATPAGTFPFQEWFVRRRHRDAVDGVRFDGAQSAEPAPGVREALAEADVIAIAPSNPYVSVAPILAVAGIRGALEQRRVAAVAVSPLIGGRAVKGPAAEMFERLAGGTTPAHVASCYAGLVDALVVDPADEDGAAAVEALGIRPVVVPTLLDDPGNRRRLADAVVQLAGAVA